MFQLVFADYAAYFPHGHLRISLIRYDTALALSIRTEHYLHELLRQNPLGQVSRTEREPQCAQPNPEQPAVLVA
jgi:hypothetical protein